MPKQDKKIVKLGFFVMTGLFLLVFMLYLIGKSKNLFGSTMGLRTRFKNANGLLIGNHIYFSGLQAGTIKDIRLLDATTVEVTMLIEDRMRAYIHKNATASIGTEGLIGNKTINITPGSTSDLPIQEGDLLLAEKSIDRNEMLLTLSRTNTNIADISTELSVLVHRINNSKALWGIMDDAGLPAELKMTLSNIGQASANVNQAAREINAIVSNVKAGKGAAGVILTDTGFGIGLRQAVSKIETFSDKASGLVDRLNAMAGHVNDDLQTGPGTAHTIFTDSTLASRLSLSLYNIERGTAAFDQNMEALKHNFLVRGYFRRLEKKQRDSIK